MGMGRVQRGTVSTASEHLFGQEHVDRYRATDGEEGFRWKRGTKILLLTTKGRRSGEERTTPLIFCEDGDDYVIVASKGGNPEHPDWYANLTADDTVGVQVKGDRFTARARTASDSERERLWLRMVEAWPDYDSYQSKTDRKIPIVILEPQP